MEQYTIHSVLTVQWENIKGSLLYDDSPLSADNESNMITWQDNHYLISGVVNFSADH